MPVNNMNIKNFDSIIGSERSMDNTLDMQKLIGSHVLSRSGTIVGRVRSIHFHPETLNLEGILVGRGIGMKKIYIGKRYIRTASHEGIILTMEPSLLIIGKKVLDKHGKVIGSVKSVHRKSQTNDVQSIVVSASFKKDLSIPWHSIKPTTHVLVVSSTYDVKQKYFWQKS